MHYFICSTSDACFQKLQISQSYYICFNYISQFETVNEVKRPIWAQFSSATFAKNTQLNANRIDFNNRNLSCHAFSLIQRAASLILQRRGQKNPQGLFSEILNYVPIK